MVGACNSCDSCANELENYCPDEHYVVCSPNKNGL
ncbi:hypothetical protein CFP56_038640 [Quercus suber]|uniref:Uncharacterized protein n=1 Tax=Quercus suber TaxID=58331 RepID=A0AAW0J1E5_QUESU